MASDDQAHMDRWSDIRMDTYARHYRGEQHSSKDLEGMSDKEHSHVLRAIGEIQRGAPEAAVFGKQGTYAKLGLGMYPWTTEHTGDLYWRTHASRDFNRSDIGEVVNKAEKVKYALDTPYGFKREMEENLQSNSRAHNDPSINWDTAVIVGKHYANEHDKLPVHNYPAELMTQATRHLGNMRFGAASATLGQLLDLTKDEDHWDHLHSRQGSIEYLRSQGK